MQPKPRSSTHPSTHLVILNLAWCLFHTDSGTRHHLWHSDLVQYPDTDLGSSIGAIILIVASDDDDGKLQQDGTMREKGFETDVGRVCRGCGVYEVAFRMSVEGVRHLCIMVSVYCGCGFVLRVEVGGS